MGVVIVYVCNSVMGISGLCINNGKSELSNVTSILLTFEKSFVKLDVYMTLSTVLLPEDIEKKGNELCCHLHPMKRHLIA